MTEPIRWSTGLQATPAQYVRLGRLIGAVDMAERSAPAGLDLTGLNPTGPELAELLDVISETDAEDQAAWDSGDYEAELAALEAEAAELLGRDVSDLSNSTGTELDLSALDFTEAIELAQDRRDQAMVRTRMAREIGRDGWQRRGDMIGLMETYLEVGTAGHRVELANAPGSDSRAIELARATTGRYASICGPADHFGRCASAYHDPGCSHVAESAAARGATPEDAAAWRDAMAQRAGLPFADADGRTWRNGHGHAATLADHIESRTGQRQAGVEFHAPRDRRELASIEPVRVVGDPSADPGEAYPDGFTPGTAATARALAAQAHLPVSADAARQRQAQTAELDRRVADRAARTSGRHHMDYGESTRERAERMHQPVALSNVSGNDLLGALPGFTYGQL